MKKGLLLCISLFLLSESQAQNKHLDFNYALTVYNLSTLTESSRTLSSPNAPSAHQTLRHVKYLQPTLAFQWQNKKRNRHEIELSQWHFRQETNTQKFPSQGSIPEQRYKSKASELAIALRYEYIITFNKKRNTRWVPALGLAASPYLAIDKIEPILSNQYTFTRTQYGVRGFLVPRLTYFFSSRIFADLNIPLCVTGISMQSDNNKDPNLSRQLQKNSLLSFDALPYLYSVRLGLGIKI